MIYIRPLSAVKYVKRRKHGNYSMCQLARDTGIDRCNFYAHYKGGVPLFHPTAVKILQALGCKIPPSDEDFKKMKEIFEVRLGQDDIFNIIGKKLKNKFNEIRGKKNPR